MSLTVYEITLDWIPDVEFVNAPTGINYLAWQIGTDVKRQLGLWLIAPVVDSPVDLVDLLPVDYVSYDLLDDTSRYGFNRSANPKKTLEGLQTLFLDTVARTTQDVIDGFR